MQFTKIAATPRPTVGKGANRRLRAAGQLPAIAYGAGSEARALAVNPTDVINVLTGELGVNTVVSLEVEGKSTTAMIREYQYHPVTRSLLHADFIEVKEDEKVEVNVPLILTGKAKGIVMGGKLRQVFRELPISCVPALIPKEIVHDITELDIEQALAVQELTLPEGVAVELPAKQTVAVIALDKKGKGEEDEAAAAAPGAAAKPAAEPATK